MRLVKGYEAHLIWNIAGLNIATDGVYMLALQRLLLSGLLWATRCVSDGASTRAWTVEPNQNKLGGSGTSNTLVSQEHQTPDT